MSIKEEEIYKVVDIVRKNRYRIPNSYGNPGGLIDLLNVDKPVLVIGDLHGAIDNLISIVEHEDNIQRLKNGEIILIIIGDGMHNDQTGQMREMQSSLLVLEEVYRLILEYKESVLYIRGNHDTFEERLAKSSIQQGLEFRNYLLEHRSESYIEATSEFFDSLPFMILGEKYIITHAGPIRNGASRHEIIDIEDNPDYVHQLVWNRLHEFRGTPSLKEYDERDIRKMIEKLKMPDDSFFIVGHNPMWSTGDKTGIWRDIIGIKNHIIIYTNIPTRGPYLYIENGTVTEKFAIESSGKLEGNYVWRN
ncbi:MAG: metallophosphoesterase [Spirochaetales bacterium]|nr:metallophosphoesterase [Spirochaetales bacterium]